MKFKGTLVITDPCYFICDSDWDSVIKNGEYVLNNLPTCPMICRETGFGDWTCSVIDIETDKEIGQFAADAGMVCVTTLENIERYNPQKVQHLKDIPWCCFILPDFNGHAWFTVDSKGNIVVHTNGSHKLWGGMLVVKEDKDELGQVYS